MKKTIGCIAAVGILLILAINIFSSPVKQFTSKLIFAEKISVFGDEYSPKSISLKKGDYIYFGSFNGENMLWKVLSVNKEGQPCLLSERVICFLPFASCREASAGISNWENSNIKKWLNSSESEDFVFECSSENRIKDNKVSISSGFLNGFSDKEISMLDTDCGILLPSTEELSALSAADRRRMPTASAAANDNSSYFQLRKYCWYWTRTPISTNTSSVTAVTSSGGYYKTLANDALTGVCPAAYLKNTEITVIGGNGSRELPYVFESGVKE